MIKFEARVAKDSWFGIGFGKKMRNADMIIFKQGKVIDSWSTGYSAPKADKEQHLEDVEISPDGDYEKYVAFRKLKAGDKQDFDCDLETDIQMMWAERRKDKFFRRHTKYNFFIANLKEDGDDDDGEPVV